MLKHRIQIIICGILVFVATMTAFSLLQNKLESLIPMAIIAFAAIRILRLISGLLYIKNIQSILTKELNPQKFKTALLKGNVTSKSLMEHAMAAFYTGDYQTAVYIVSFHLNYTAKKTTFLSFLDKFVVLFYLGVFLQPLTILLHLRWLF